jgi:hypothetical protein
MQNLKERNIPFLLYFFIFPILKYLVDFHNAISFIIMLKFEDILGFNVPWTNR